MSVAATLRHAGSYDLVNNARCTITSLPAAGEAVTQGQCSTRETEAVEADSE
jgi:hypothetical protein